MADPRTAPSCPPNTGPKAEFISVDDGCRKYGISRSMFYALMREGKIKSYKVGRRRFLNDHSTREYFLAQGEA